VADLAAFSSGLAASTTGWSTVTTMTTAGEPELRVTVPGPFPEVIDSDDHQATRGWWLSLLNAA
jgi:hypothetical protein